MSVVLALARRIPGAAMTLFPVLAGAHPQAG
jgi:hypothetical protein